MAVPLKESRGAEALALSFGGYHRSAELEQGLMSSILNVCITGQLYYFSLLSSTLFCITAVECKYVTCHS